MLGHDCSRETELKDENGREYFRSAYVSKTKKYIKLRVYSRIIAEIEIKADKNNVRHVLIKDPSKITKKQIEQFFAQYDQEKQL